jgi:hypothetical protein
VPVGGDTVTVIKGTKLKGLVLGTGFPKKA